METIKNGIIINGTVDELVSDKKLNCPCKYCDLSKFCYSNQISLEEIFCNTMCKVVGVSVKGNFFKKLNNQNMNILHLHLKKEGYQKIENGGKTEEYIDINAYWAKRLTTIKYTTDILYSETIPCLIDRLKEESSFKHFDVVTFSYGYTKRTMTFLCEGIEFGTGKSEWGAEMGKEYFVIKLGMRLQ